MSERKYSQASIGARIEIAGCSLCMGNQARVPDSSYVFSTSTRNFDDRVGDGARDETAPHPKFARANFDLPARGR